MADVLVETFELEELTTEGREAPEVEAVAVQLAEELGLEGQKRLITRQEPEDPGTRNPYPVMTAEEKRVYETICAVSTPLAEYDAGIIPLRVLQVASHAAPLFPAGLEVWYPGVAIPDPILVGVDIPNPAQTWQKRYHILARWGAELAPFEELREKAVELITRKWKNDLAEKLEQCRSFESTLEAKVEKHMNGEWVVTP